MNPRVSAIIIFLNGEKFLAEAIESVIAQSYADWELMLCDDGSTDGATVIARHYEQAYPGKIRYLEHPGHANCGMSATRMLGVQNSRGEFVTWLDADDVWTTNKLQRQVAILDSHAEAAMVYGPLLLWYSWSGRPQDRNRDFLQDLGVPTDRIIHPPTIVLKFLHDVMHHPSGVMVRRRVLEAVGGYEDSFRAEYEDVIVQSKVCLQYPVYAAGESWYKYRQHEGSCCALMRREGRDRSTRLPFLNRLAEFLREKNINDPQVWAALAEQLKPFKIPLVYRLSEATRASVRVAKRLAKRTIAKPMWEWLRSKYYGEEYSPPAGWVRFGSLRRSSPIAREFGWHRGLPADRYYIEKFLNTHRADIRGRVLEIGDPAYTKKFGGGRVTQSDVLHAVAGNPHANLVGDLQTGAGIPSEAFDCIILTQVLPFLYDFRAAIATCMRSLKPGGVLLLTVPCISQVSPYDRDRWGDYWRFTSGAVRRLLSESTPEANVQVRSYGNVLVAASFLYGVTADELTSEELDNQDEEFELIVSARSVKPRAAEIGVSGDAMEQGAAA